MCIKFRLKTDLERRFPRRDCFWSRGWYIQDSTLSVWGNTRQNLRLLFKFCKDQLANCGYPTWPYWAQIRAQIRPNTVFGAHIWTLQIWSSGVSLKRSCEMQFRRVGLRSIGPSSQKLWPNQIFGRFPHCNYNVKLKIAARMSFMGL